MTRLVYYSSQTGNTDSFVQRLGEPAIKLPTALKEPVILTEPFVLILPTYAAGDGRGSVPKSVIKFLNEEKNRLNLQGVIASGNMTFGENYCIGGRVVSVKCNVPLLYCFELRGTERDILNVRTELLKIRNNI
jgi:protein involved in ribonucleotide reduction